MQLPIYLLILILNGKNTGSSPLTLTTCLFIEMQLNGIAFKEFAKPDKIVNPSKNTFLANQNIFIYTMLFFSSNTYECQQYHQHE